MYKMKKMVLGSALLLAMASVQAAESPRWDNVAVSYERIDVDGDTLDGFGFSGTKLLGKNIFVNGSYGNVSNEFYGVDYTYKTMSLGLGARVAVTDSTDLYGIISYEDVELDASYYNNSASDGDNGHGMAFGARTMLTDKFELNGGFKFIEIADESETAINVSALYKFTDNVSGGLGITRADDVDSISISAVYYF